MTTKSERRKNKAYWRKKRLLRPNSMYCNRVVPKHLKETVRAADRWKYKIKIRESFYSDFVYTSLWYTERERLKIFLKELKAINIFFKKDLKSSLNLMIEIVDVATHFYDEGLLHLAPANKLDAVEEFNANLSVLACREKTPHGFWNQSPIGEKVTFDNLYLAVSDKITPREARKLPKLLVTEYHGEYFMPVVPYKPLREWATKKQKAIFTHNYLEFNADNFVQETIKVKNIIQRNIETLLE